MYEISGGGKKGGCDGWLVGLRWLWWAWNCYWGWYHVDCNYSDRSLALVPHDYCDDTSARNHALKSPPTRQPRKRDCSWAPKRAGQKVDD